MSKNTVTVGGETKELTSAQYRKIQELLDMQEVNIEAFEDFVGQDIFVRTVTMAYTGHVEWVKGKWMKLSTATWVADTGRFSDFVLKGKPSGGEEYEPMGTTVINTDTFLDITLLQMELPFSQK
jgi:hypothetical protein